MPCQSRNGICLPPTVSGTPGVLFADSGCTATALVGISASVNSSTQLEAVHYCDQARRLFTVSPLAVTASFYRSGAACVPYAGTLAARELKATAYSCATDFEALARKERSVSATPRFELRASGEEGADGSFAEAGRSFFDTQLGARCEAASAGAGAVCSPTGSFGYVDSSCSVLAYLSGGAPAPKYASNVGYAAGIAQAPDLYEVGVARPEKTQYFRNVAGQCQASPLVGSLVFHSIVAVAPSLMATMSSIIVRLP